MRLAAIVTCLVACGGSSPAPDGAAAGTDAPASSACPSAQPAAGSSCSVDQLACEYGTDPALECDTIMTCGSGAWVTTQTPFTGGTFCSTAPGPGSCPQAVADVAQGTTCGSAFFECYFPQAICECRCPGPGNGVTCVPASAAMTWQCDSSSIAGCPAVRPRLGDTCSDADQFCDYSGDGSAACWGDQLQCTGGVWVNVGLGLGC